MIASHGKARILVVDDEKLILLTMSAKLRSVGYAVVPMSDVDSAVRVLKENPKAFSAIITDIMMGDMDGFVFRDIIRGVDPTMPIFFLTALDPEEGGGFLKRIMEDPISYYLPKAVKTEVILRRIRQVVASRRVENFIEQKIEDDRKSLELASHIQRSILPRRTLMTPRGFYATWWKPVDIVSGDLYEAVPFGMGCYLYVLGDIQGHGTSAALAMTAVQSFLKNFAHKEGLPLMGVEEIANMLQKFFRTNLAEVSYMTALLCIHRPLKNNVEWISCGAPDLVVVDDGKTLNINPEKKGGVPIGLLPDTEYTKDDVLQTTIGNRAVCVAYTDGLVDLAKDSEGLEPLPEDLHAKLREEIIASARDRGAMVAAPAKFMKACQELGYNDNLDDMTILAFGARIFLPGIYEATVELTPDDIDAASQGLAEWCAGEHWDEGLVQRVQLVLEEKLMNVYDHGFDERDRLREVVSFRLRAWKHYAELTVWDYGTVEPSLNVVAADSDVVFERQNQSMSNHGRGRLMVRELCTGIERNRYANLNETIYNIPKDPDGGPLAETLKCGEKVNS